MAKLFPHEDQWTDRITNQLMFVPPNYRDLKMSGQLKTILLYNGLGPWNVKQGNVIQFFIVGIRDCDMNLTIFLCAKVVTFSSVRNVR